ncbi:MAG: hypothetical protein AB7E72_18305 [Lysobacterales bacterium]
MRSFIIGALLLVAGPAFAIPLLPKDSQCEPNIAGIQAPATELTFFSSGFTWIGESRAPGGLNELPTFRASACAIVIRRDPPASSPSFIGEDWVQNPQHYAMDFTQSEILDDGEFSPEMAFWQIDFKGSLRPDSYLRLYIEPELQQIIVEQSTTSPLGSNRLERVALPYSMRDHTTPCAQIDVFRTQNPNSQTRNNSQGDVWTVQLTCPETQIASSAAFSFGGQVVRTVKYGRLNEFEPIGNFTIYLLRD